MTKYHKLVWLDLEPEMENIGQKRQKNVCQKLRLKMDSKQKKLKIKNCKLEKLQNHICLNNPIFFISMKSHVYFNIPQNYL